MKNSPELVDKYDTIIQNQLQLGVTEKVINNSKKTTKHYIPHHAVINPEKTSTKVRVVYDASAKINKGRRYPLNKIAIVADIEKAFLQIGLLEDAKDMTRFFWLKNKG